MSLLSGILVTLLIGCVALNAATSVSMSGLHVSGNVILNGNNQQIQIHGVDKSGSEYACVQGWGFFDGHVDQASITAMQGWGINAVRVPLNEDCWLGINGVSSTYSGSNYISQITSYINLITSNNMVAIVDLHWTNSGTDKATQQQQMPDSDHSPAFWTSVANNFKSNSAVIFDLFNEPFPDSNGDSTNAWACLKSGGGSCPGLSYTAVGMQTLVTTVRNTGAPNILMIAGIQYANQLDHWLSYVPSDPLNQIVASAHLYNFNACKDVTCWNTYLLPVAQKYPIIMGEIGENDCASSFITSLMTWADSYCINYLAWAWNTADCTTFPALITDESGTPTGFGAGYKSHISSRPNTCTSSITSTPTQTPAVTPVPSPAATTRPASTPSTAKPVTTQPVTTQPVTTKPVTTQPVTTQPVTTKAVATTQHATSAPSQVIYDTQLQNGWQSWSWATVNLANASPAHSTPNSISFVLNNYQGLYLHQPTAFGATSFASLTFWVNGGSLSKPGSSVLVEVYDTTSPTPVVKGLQVAFPNAIVANTWVQQTILMTAFGYTGSISGITMQYNGGDNAGTIYVDDVSLNH